MYISIYPLLILAVIGATVVATLAVVTPQINRKMPTIVAWLISLGALGLGMAAFLLTCLSMTYSITKMEQQLDTLNLVSIEQVFTQQVAPKGVASEVWTLIHGELAAKASVVKNKALDQQSSTDSVCVTSQDMLKLAIDHESANEALELTAPEVLSPVNDLCAAYAGIQAPERLLKNLERNSSMLYALLPVKALNWLSSQFSNG